MSTRQGNIALIVKLNVRKFAFDSNSPNLLFAKCTMYMVYDFAFYLYTLSFTENGSGNGELTESRSALQFVLIITVDKHVVLFVFIYSMLFLLYRLHGYEKNQ